MADPATCSHVLEEQPQGQTTLASAQSAAGCPAATRQCHCVTAHVLVSWVHPSTPFERVIWNTIDQASCFQEGVLVQHVGIGAIQKGILLLGFWNFLTL